MTHLRKRSECTCSCHGNPGMMHFVACCEPDAIGWDLQGGQIGSFDREIMGVSLQLQREQRAAPADPPPVEMPTIYAVGIFSGEQTDLIHASLDQSACKRIADTRNYFDDAKRQVVPYVPRVDAGKAREAILEVLYRLEDPDQFNGAAADILTICGIGKAGG